MRKAAILLALLSLSGCATTKYQRVYCVTPQEVEEQRQAEPPKIADRLSGKADEDVKVIAGSAVRLRAWGNGMLGILEGCAG